MLQWALIRRPPVGGVVVLSALQVAISMYLFSNYHPFSWSSFFVYLMSLVDLFGYNKLFNILSMHFYSSTRLFNKETNFISNDLL